ncbi:MAG: hypothetical protein ACI3VB_05040 [Oscillospiraceae bacterium]
MAMRLVDGRYIPDVWGGFETVSGEKALMQRLFFRLIARRGAFPLLPELGSRLYLLTGVKPSERKSAAEMYVREAVSEENVELKSVDFTEQAGEIVLSMTFAYSGGELPMTLTMMGE